MQSEGSRAMRAKGSPTKLSGKEYRKQLLKLQVKLCQMQDWVRETGARIIVVVEGRDTAGKGGLIKAITERVSPRTFRTVALSAPTEREKTQLFLQRYVEHFPAAGEVILFDRSWYNRAGVDRVMGFAGEEEVESFLANVPQFERWLVFNGITLIKLWLEVGMKEQQRRFRARIDDPLRQWKLSPMDLESYTRWYGYSRARDAMLSATDHGEARWHILRTDDKKRGRLNGIAHILSAVPYEAVKRSKPKLPKRSTKGSYDDALDCSKLAVVPEIY